MKHPDKTPKPQRRWWQFRLRTMLLALTLVGIGLGLISIPLSEYYREQRIVAPLQASGGQVRRHFASVRGARILRLLVGDRPFLRVDSITNATGTPVKNLDQFPTLHHLTSITLRGITLSDKDLKDISRVRELSSLDIFGSQVTDASLQHLQRHKQLQRLNVAQTPISDAALEQLATTLPQSPRLLQQRAVDELHALGCSILPRDDPRANSFSAVLLRNVTANDLRHLQRLPGLKRLETTNIQLTHDSLQQIGKLSDLQTLVVQNGRIPHGALEQLSELKGLQSLRFRFIPINDEDLAHIGVFHELRELRLNNTRVTGLTLAHVQSLKKLKLLSLEGIQRVYDVDLELLYPLKNLQSLVVPDARITPAAVARLQKALPHLRMTFGKTPRNLSGIGPPASAGPAAQSAFWAGNYEQLEQCLVSDDGKSNWKNHLWLGHARELNGDWPGAIVAYQVARRLLDEAVIASRDANEHGQFATEWTKLILLMGRAQLELLNEPREAIATLRDGLRFAPAASRPTSELAQEAAKQIDDLATPHETPVDEQRLIHDLVFPLATQHHLALAYKKAGVPAAALECWTRVRLCHLAYRTRHHWEYRAHLTEPDAVHLAKLWASLEEKQPRPALPLFSVINSDQQLVTLTPKSGASRITSWAPYAWDCYALVPRPGYAIASLQLECTPEKDDSKSKVSCWANAVTPHNRQAHVVLDDTHVARGKSKTIDVDVRWDEDLLVVSATGIASVTLRAILRPRTGKNEAPKQERTASQRARPRELVTEASPFRCVDNQYRQLVHQSMGSTAMAKLPNGQWIVAFGSGAIELAMTQDGKTWEGPFPFPHNEIFPTRNPSLCIDDNGLLWMTYLSKRPSYKFYSSAPYYLYRTSSRDGRHWSRPKPIQTCEWIQYQDVPYLTRGPHGRFQLFLRDEMTSARSPDQFPPTQRVNIPIHANGSPVDLHVALDDQQRCHGVYSVYGDPRQQGRLHYSYANTDGVWRGNTLLKEIDETYVRTPQWMIEGDRLALLYWTNHGLWLRRGRLTPEGPHMGPAQQITDGRVDGEGAQWVRDGDSIYLPLPAHPPILLRAKLEDLLGD